MATAVYSTRFLGALVSVDETLTATVPDGFVWVVVDVSALLVGSSSTNVSVYNGTSGANIAYMQATSSGAEQHSWSGRQVLTAGEDLLAACEGVTAVRLGVSGYTLSV